MCDNENTPPVMPPSKSNDDRGEDSKSNGKNRIFNRTISQGIIIAVVSSIIVALLTIVYDTLVTQRSIEKIMDVKMDALKDTTTTNINGLKEIVAINLTSFDKRADKNIDDINKRIDNIENSIREISPPIHVSSAYSFTDPTFTYNDTFALSSHYGSFLYAIAPLNFDDNEEVGINSETNSQLVFADLKGRHFITNYWDEISGLEMWVYGGVDGNGNWLGRCTLNGYNYEGELEYLLEAEFEDGINISEYEEIKYDRQRDEYVFSKSVYRNGYLGENNEYEIYVCKSFNSSTKKKAEMPIKYSSCKPNELKIYYNGEIADGTFNDTTGKAYLVSYDEDGTIKTLYRGNFRDGDFHDNRQLVSPINKSSNAFWISWDNKESVYVFCIGPFKEGWNAAGGTKEQLWHKIDGESELKYERYTSAELNELILEFPEFNKLPLTWKTV